MKGSHPGYEEMRLYFGDLHNHCGISYGHGSLEDALNNARERLDFCSVTGHAHWPDMPAVNERNRHVIKYHREGFSKLRKNWSAVRRTMEAWNQEESFLTFLGFEIHSNASGDYTVLYRDFTGSLLYPDSIGTLKKQLQDLSRRGIETLAFPHHTGNLKGARGINWDDLSETRSPIVEIVSMHGCSETDESAAPTLLRATGSTCAFC